MLRFVRDHVATGETCYLGAADLEFGELLPAKPVWLAQDEYEERIRPVATLSDLAKTLDRMAGPSYGRLRRHDSPSVDEESTEPRTETTSRSRVSTPTADRKSSSSRGHRRPRATAATAHEKPRGE